MTEAEELVDHLDKEHSILAHSIYPLATLRSYHDDQHRQRAWPHDHEEGDGPAPE